MIRTNNTFNYLIRLFCIAVLFLATSCGSKDWQSELDDALAAGTRGPEQLIKSLEEFIDMEPPEKFESEARFTIAFTFAEGLEQYNEARRWFNELLEEDPGSEWAEEAEWMLENMEKDIEDILPNLREEIPPPVQEIPPSAGEIPPL